jgi:uncharacterized protein YxeA
MKRILASILAVLLPIVAIALLANPNVKLKGAILSLDLNSFVVKSGNQKIEVPRKLYEKDPKVGENVQIEMDEATFESLKKESVISSNQ